MNSKEIKTFNDLKILVEDNSRTANNILLCLTGDPKNSEDKGLMGSVGRINKTLNGDPDDREDLGLVGDVRNNKRWKNNVNKALGSLGLGFLGLFIKQIFESIKRGG